MGAQKLDRINSLPSPPKQDRSKSGATFDASGERIAIQISEPDEMLCPRDAAQLLGVEPKTLANWRWQKRGPAYTKDGLIGRSGVVRYRRVDLIELVRANSCSEHHSNG